MVEGLSGLRDLVRFAFTVGISSASMDPNHTWLGWFSGAGCTSKFLSVAGGLLNARFWYVHRSLSKNTNRKGEVILGRSQLLKNAVTIIPQGSTLYL